MVNGGICKDCGNEKQGCYKKESYCGKCLSIRRKALRKAKADSEAGRKRKYVAREGQGRSSLCSKCGKEKDNSFLTSGYCRNCRAEINREKRLRKRLDQGLLPWGDGRNPKCYCCGGKKENQKQGYCNKCRNEKERAAREKRNISDPNFKYKESKKYKEKFVRDPLFKLKKYAHDYVFKCIKAGFLVPSPCENCGDLKVDAHHDDYTKPMDVRWLCRQCHVSHHRS